MSDKKLNSQKSSKEIIKESWQARKKAWKQTVQALGNILKWTYKAIDAWDRLIWEQIEKNQINKWKRSPWRVKRFLRDNTIKLLIASSLAGYWWYKTINTPSEVDKQQDKQELVLSFSESENKIKEILISPDVLEDLKHSGKEWEDKREKRYLWADEAWSNMRSWFWYKERQKIIEWMCNMVESWDFEMVIRKADEAWVPRQCVFLALAESWWQSDANSWVAWWYRQFTEKSAKLFWLIDEEWNDYRWDPEKSTDAAMQHLKENYKIISNYNQQLWYKMTESDKWIFAFYMYNWSPKLVKQWIIACQWDANRYSENQPNTENRNYVPRILAIQNALQKIFQENWYDTQKIRSTLLMHEIIKTEADLMFDDYLQKAKNLTDKEKIKQLDEIKLKYKEEYKSGQKSKAYYDWAIRIIEDIKPQYKNKID